MESDLLSSQNNLFLPSGPNSNQTSLLGRFKQKVALMYSNKSSNILQVVKQKEDAKVNDHYRKKLAEVSELHELIRNPD